MDRFDVQEKIIHDISLESLQKATESSSGGLISWDYDASLKVISGSYRTRSLKPGELATLTMESGEVWLICDDLEQEIRKTLDFSKDFHLDIDLHEYNPRSSKTPPDAAYRIQVWLVSNSFPDYIDAVKAAEMIRRMNPDG